MGNYSDAEENSNNSKKQPPKKENMETRALDAFCRDITSLAKEGKLDLIVGREKETMRLCQVLSRRVKHNPVLIGDPGVGKTAIVEKLAQMIVDGRAPRTLQNKRIYSLDLSSMVAGTKYRGQFEERMKSVLDDIRNNPDVIIFIDEIHTIVGAGNASGSLDAANIFKPALSRGEVQVIGATTMDEYRENIEKDMSLVRRFQQIIIYEPTIQETKTILKNIKYKYEEYHRVKYTDEAIDECVNLSERYITDRFLPDKAIDVMDEAGATTNVSFEIPAVITSMEKEKRETCEEKLRCVKLQDYEKAQVFRDKESLLDEKIRYTRRKWIEESETKEHTIITGEMVAETISIMTKIPANKISLKETKNLVNMEKELNSKIIGQQESVAKITKAIKRGRLGIKDKNKPPSFMFLGKTGVGKCVVGDTTITVRNKRTGVVEDISIKGLLSRVLGSK